MCKLKNELESRGELSIKRECIREKCISEDIIRENTQYTWKMTWILTQLKTGDHRDDRFQKSSPAGTKGDLEGIQQWEVPTWFLLAVVSHDIISQIVALSLVNFSA